MTWRRVATGLIGLCALAGLGVALAARGASTRLVVGSMPIGAPRGIGVDSRLGRAFILDDDVRQQQVTLQGNGWTYSGYTTNNKLRVIDTRTGRLVKAISVSPMAQSLAVDAATGRVFVFDQGQIEVIDAHSGASLGTAPFTGAPNGYNDSIDTTLVDERSGRLFATRNPSNYNEPTDQHVLALDGRTGRTLRTLTFPHGPADTARQPNGSTATYYPLSLSLALDGRAGRLYVFNTTGQMSVADVRSGRILSTRRLPVGLMGARADERTGEVFAIATQPPPRGTPFYAWQRRPSALVMLDPRAATIRRIAAISGPGAITVDADDNRVFVFDLTRHAIDVFDATSGRPVRSVAFGAMPIQLLADAPHHRALVVLVVARGYNFMTTDTRIAVLDTRGGSLLRTIPMQRQFFGYAPLGVDTASGHIVAAYSAMSSGPADRYDWMPAWLRGRLPWIPAPPPALGPNQRLITHTAMTLDPS